MTQTPKQNSPEAALGALLAIMGKLRDPDGGCPLDLVQEFASIAPYTIEEGYEVADAIAAEDPGKLLDELGDLLFQVVFHAQLAQEQVLLLKLVCLMLLQVEPCFVAQPFLL